MMRAIPALLAAVLLMGSSSHARPHYASKAVMIARSEAIAVVEVRQVSSVRARGGRWTYAQAADAVVLQTLKGDLPERVRLYAQENFVCTRVDFRPGRYVVFLRRDGELLAGSNWYLSARPIRNATVEWYANDMDSGSDESEIHMRRVPLAAVLRDVQRHVARVPAGI